MKRRLDTRLAEALAVSRNQAAAFILAGEVTVDGQPARKPGQLVAADSSIKRTGGRTDVSRSAAKLRGALDDWPEPITGEAALDVGSSTGGFTQVLLEHGARHVYAVDVGRGQLAWSLRQDPRVTNLEQTDIRKLEPLPELVALAVVDVSFISLRQVLPAVAKRLGPAKPVIALFKPQFEVGRIAASRGRGVIRDPAVVRAALDELADWLAGHGWQLRDQRTAAVAGRHGNQEWLLRLVTPVD